MITVKRMEYITLKRRDSNPPTKKGDSKGTEYSKTYRTLRSHMFFTVFNRH